MKTLLFIPLLAISLSAQLFGQPDKNMDAMRIWKMTEILELTEEQSTKFLPALQIHERELKAMQNNMRDLHQQNEKLLDKKDISQREVDALMKSYITTQNEMHTKRQEFIISISEYLTPEQQLKFIGFEHRFRKDLREYMKDRRNPRQGNQRRRP